MSSWWTQEPAREDGEYHAADAVNFQPLGIARLKAGTKIADYWVRSVRRIPNAGVLDALENLAATVRREIDAGADGNSDNIDAALRALEEARRG